MNDKKLDKIHKLLLYLDSLSTFLLISTFAFQFVILWLATRGEF